MMKILTILLLLIASPAYAFLTERETLAGLKGTTVQVAVTDDAVKAGLTLDMVKTAVLLKLRQNTIDIVESIKANTPESKRASLSVSVDVQTVNGKPVHAVQVLLKQPALLIRNPNMTIMAPTWTSSIVNGVGDVTMIRQAIDKLLDALMNDWLEANPARKK